MRRRDALVIGGVFAVALAVPPVLRMRADPFEFIDTPGLPGFRNLVRGEASRAGSVFAGLQASREHDAAPIKIRDLCRAIFPRPVPAGQVPIAVFSDYYCPYCATLDSRLAQMVRDGAPIDLIFHELPLLGARSVRAARVALAAGLQGDHTKIHLDMMQRVLRPGMAGLRDVAAHHTLDLARLTADVSSERITQAIEQSLVLGRTLGFPGTPGLAIGRTIVQGALSGTDLERLISLEKDGGKAICVTSQA